MFFIEVSGYLLFVIYSIYRLVLFSSRGRLRFLASLKEDILNNPTDWTLYRKGDYLKLVKPGMSIYLTLVKLNIDYISDGEDHIHELYPDSSAILINKGEDLSVLEYSPLWKGRVSKIFESYTLQLCNDQLKSVANEKEKAYTGAILRLLNKYPEEATSLLQDKYISELAKEALS